MTDNEIIKALECCVNNQYCWLCILKDREDDCHDILKSALDLINRQKAEIARLRAVQGSIDNFARDLCKERLLKGKAIADFEDLQEYIRKEKSEAIREFAEKLKQQAFSCDVSFGFGKEHYTKAVAAVDIDRLFEKMTEGGK